MIVLDFIPHLSFFREKKGLNDLYEGSRSYYLYHQPKIIVRALRLRSG